MAKKKFSCLRRKFKGTRNKFKNWKACIAAIKKLGHKVEIFDPKKSHFSILKKAIQTLFLTHSWRRRRRWLCAKFF